MPVTVQCRSLPLKERDVRRLWLAVRAVRKWGDAVVAVRCVSARTSAGLNRRYRRRRGATDVLTFSYEADNGGVAEHDVALCLMVARREARARGVSWRSYVAWLLVHAFLHATGLEHELSAAAARRYEALEASILRRFGFLRD